MKQFASSFFIATICLFWISCTTTRENANPTAIVPNGTVPGIAALKVVNSSSYAIYYLYVSNVADTSWGTDQLDSSIIAVNNSFTVPNIPVGRYDFCTRTIGYAQETTLTGVLLSTGQTYVWTVTNGSFPAPAHFKIVNNSPDTIALLQAKPLGASYWNPDLLGKDVFLDYNTSFLRFMTPGTYDMKVTSRNGKSATTLAVVLTAGNTTTWTINILSKLATGTAVNREPTLLLAKDGALTDPEGVNTISSEESDTFQKPVKQVIAEPMMGFLKK
jgi:hypothetical protein